MASHARLSPSSAHRWLNCAGSPRAAETLGAGVDRPSVYAEEGSAAHDVAALTLEGKDIPDTVRGFAVDEEMTEAVNVYVDRIRGILKRADWHQIEKSVMIDKPSQTFGTSDFLAVVLAEERLYVDDYKHGKGISVSALDNEQLRMYGIGAFNAVPSEYKDKIKYVELTITQPRAPGDKPFRQEVITVLDLFLWRDTVLLPGIRNAMDPGAPLVAGTWCRFCPALANCPEARKHAQHVAKKDFQDTPPDADKLSDAELGEVLNEAEMIHAWVQACRAEASGRLDQGGDIPGWKLVDKRATRRWKNDKAVRAILNGAGLKEDEYLDTKLLSPAQIEKKLDKDKWGQLADLIEKKSSGTTLVPTADARAAVKAGAASDFEVV